MKTFIHIGQPKTGTTSIQEFLQKNRDELIKKKIFVPREILGHDSPSQYLLNVYALDNARNSYKKEELVALHGADYINDLKTQIPAAIRETYRIAEDKGANKIMWSNEGLYFLNSLEEYTRLLSLFESYSDEVVVICCFREFNSFRKSYIGELKRMRLKGAYEDDSYRNTEKNSWLWDETSKRELLKASFKRCIFFDYNPQNNIKAFLDVMGIDHEEANNVRLNVAPHKWWQRLLYMFKSCVRY